MDQPGRAVLRPVERTADQAWRAWINRGARSRYRALCGVAQPQSKNPPMDRVRRRYPRFNRTFLPENSRRSRQSRIGMSESRHYSIRYYSVSWRTEGCMSRQRMQPVARGGKTSRSFPLRSALDRSSCAGSDGPRDLGMCASVCGELAMDSACPSAFAPSLFAQGAPTVWDAISPGCKAVATPPEKSRRDAATPRYATENGAPADPGGGTTIKSQVPRADWRAHGRRGAPCSG